MFKKYMVTTRMVKTEKIIKQLLLALRSQYFTYVSYKYLYINLDILGKENCKSCKIILL